MCYCEELKRLVCITKVPEGKSEYYIAHMILPSREFVGRGLTAEEAIEYLAIELNKIVERAVNR